jgi:cytochrome c553
MKNLKRISYIMISLILFQSFSAVANSLDFHAIDTQHLQHEHQHSEHNQASNDMPTKVLGESAKAEHHNPADCHHCGHCHGTHAQWLSQHKINNLQSVVSTHNFNYLDAIIDAPINRLLRPPKTSS